MVSHGRCVHFGIRLGMLVSLPRNAARIPEGSERRVHSLYEFTGLLVGAR
jgi:hypothetical protein